MSVPGPHAWLNFVDPSCRNIAPEAVVTASHHIEGHEPARAVDGDRNTSWSAGKHAPAWWQADFGRPRQIRGIVLVPAMEPSPAGVTHVIETLLAEGECVPWLVLRQPMTSGGIYVIGVGDPRPACVVRVRTLESPSWVAWHEIGIFA
jgi:hypothetical protein